MPSDALLAPTNRRRTRSVGFFDHAGLRWACYLVTHRASGRTWRGHLAFRTDRPVTDEATAGICMVRTAEIFIEPSEAEIDRKARQMGRPLLSGLLASALEVEELARQEALAGPELRGWVQEALRDRVSEVPFEGVERREDVADQRSRYETYRIDQVTHLVSLIEPSALERLVDEMLQGEPFKFGAKDRLQFAMMVVQRLEALLPLPPLEVFLRDYAESTGEHERYHHDLYSEDSLP